MDDRLRQEVAAWLDFYRELGIEEFYARPPGSVPKLGSRVAPAIEARVPEPQPAESESRAPFTMPKTPFPESTGPALPVAPPLEQTSPTAATPRAAPDLKSRIDHTLSLFEAPAPVRGPETLAQIREDLGDCQRCKLAGGRKHIVFGDGDPHAAVVFIGEGPGADEDEQGLPFVGRAGKLLNRMLESVGIKRQDVYICNVVKCRPPGNRTPERDEVDACSPFLFRQLEAIHPRLICCLGLPAAKTVLGVKEGITRVRGQFFTLGGAKAIATVHPAYVLRNPREEKILREDFEKIRDFLKASAG
jgi:uracil-DNA glycosylase